MQNKQRCKWCNLKNEKYIKYHDEEWGILNLNEQYLFEMLILESFQAGLTWECVLNKREDFREAFDNFNIENVIFNFGTYNELEKDLIKKLKEKNIKYYKDIKELNINDSKLYFLNTGIYDNENDNSNVI